MKKQLLSLAAASALLLAASSSFAAMPIISGTLNYDVTLADTCVVSVTGASFGTWPVAGPITAGLNAGNINVTTCTVPYVIYVNGGVAPAAAARTLGGATNVTYKLMLGATEVGDLGANAAGVGAADSATWAGTSPITVAAAPFVVNHALTADLTVAGTAVAGNHTDTVAVNFVY
jgi:hypothetical protein